MLISAGSFVTWKHEGLYAASAVHRLFKSKKEKNIKFRLQNSIDKVEQTLRT